MQLFKNNYVKDSIFEAIGKNNTIIIEENCSIRGLRILIGDNSKIIIGKGTTINASKTFPTIINALENTEIVIGDNCLLSNSIEIHTTDYHSILDFEGNRMNKAKNIHIGNNTWIGLRSIILKGTYLQANTIVAANSVVTKSFNNTHIIIAGNPAIEIGEYSSWISERI